MNEVSLKLHEWLVILILIGTIFCLAIFTSTAGPSIPLHPITEYNKGVEVIVKGAVLNPGAYRLPTELTMAEILEIAIAKPEADLRRFNIQRPVRKGRLLNIPTRLMMTVHINGAVKEPLSLQVPKGSRMHDLISLVALDEKANVHYLQKKRLLKADEHLTIPYEK